MAMTVRRAELTTMQITNFPNRLSYLRVDGERTETCLHSAFTSKTCSELMHCFLPSDSLRFLSVSGYFTFVAVSTKLKLFFGQVVLSRSNQESAKEQELGSDHDDICISAPSKPYETPCSMQV